MTLMNIINDNTFNLHNSLMAIGIRKLLEANMSCMEKNCHIIERVECSPMAQETWVQSQVVSCFLVKKKKRSASYLPLNNMHI